MRASVKWAMIAAAWVAAVPGAAWAADSEPCAKGMVCASDPQTVIAALQEAGYKAKLGKSESTGNPKIDSAAAGFNFTIYFYECEKAKQCGSLQFNISFNNDDGANTPELANKWNANKRFIQMSVDDDKFLNCSYDVATIGGLNPKNFADVLDWWQVMLGQLRTFFDDNEPKKS